MNNEEKILQMLTHLTERQDTTEKMLTHLTEKVTNLEQGQDKLREDVTKIQITQENTIIPSIQILKEGQLTIQNQIKKLSVIDAMQDDIAMLKTAVKFLSQEVDKLQKAI